MDDVRVLAFGSVKEEGDDPAADEAKQDKFITGVRKKQKRANFNVACKSTHASYVFQ